MESNPEIKIAIKDWPLSERPRERLLAEGPEVLSSAELLAVLLRNGAKGRDAVMLARDLLGKFGGLRGLFTASKKDLSAVNGLGPAKISALFAVTELAKRQFAESLPERDLIRDPEGVVQYLKSGLQDQKIEIFKVIYLNKANRILAAENLSKGTVDEAAVHPREIVRRALEHQATGLILAHNHPSGRVEPSPEDRSITAKIRAACETVSVKVLDHLIIGDQRHFSFKEHGFL